MVLQIRDTATNSSLIGPVPLGSLLQTLEAGPRLPGLLLLVLKDTVQGQAAGRGLAALCPWAGRPLPFLLSPCHAAYAEPAQLEITGHPCLPAFLYPVSAPAHAHRSVCPRQGRRPTAPNEKCSYESPSPCSPGINFAVSFQLPLAVCIPGPKENLFRGFGWPRVEQCSDWDGGDPQMTSGSRDRMRRAATRHCRGASGP